LLLVSEPLQVHGQHLWPPAVRRAVVREISQTGEPMACVTGPGRRADRTDPMAARQPGRCQVTKLTGKVLVNEQNVHGSAEGTDKRRSQP